MLRSCFLISFDISFDIRRGNRHRGCRDYRAREVTSVIAIEAVVIIEHVSIEYVKSHREHAGKDTGRWGEAT